MKLGFDLPGQIGSTIFLQDDVVAGSVDVFSVEEETVHVEETGTHFGKPGREGSSLALDLNWMEKGDAAVAKKMN